jgi:hypothetical protein
MKATQPALDGWNKLVELSGAMRFLTHVATSTME